MATVGDTLKRVILGRAISTAKTEHHLLPKTLALPVFSSDPLSSVAYATEEMMLILVLAGAAALALMVPIGLAIAAVLLIVVTSYRQTVRAYPRGGGSYIVARENLGTFPGLLAASAILIGYVVTAAVSVTAGAIAITSAVPELAPHRVNLALGFIALIALVNLRGVRESGMLFAVPTYGFVAVVGLTVITGLVRCVGGCPEAATAGLPLEATQSITIFLVLQAFTQGSSALTGVEAIADGVQAFRRPQGKNAAATLSVMAVMSISMFLGITFLARTLDVRVTEEIVASRSVLSQIGATIFGRGALFIGLQAFTAMILIVAANTAYQDFPRLSAILARDRFMPGQFKNRGDRLVFSNGILVLSVLAGALVWAFDGRLTRLIPLYLVGVFTAFTLSQSGMVRRWASTKEAGWRRNAMINGIGATTTGVVLAVVVVTRFAEGAWMVVAALPIMITALLQVNRHYTAVSAALDRHDVNYRDPGLNRVVLVLTDFDPATAEALGYVRSLRPAEVHPVYAGDRPIGDAQALWAEMSRGLPPLEPAEGRSRVEAVIEHVRRVPRDPGDFVTVVIPEFFPTRSLVRALVKPVTFRLKVRLLAEPQVVVTDVPVLAQEGELVGVDGRALIPPRVEALVFVSSVNDATVRAVNYARSLNAHETRAVFLATEPEEAPEILQRWAERGIGIRLDVVEAPFRDLGPPLLEEVRRVTTDPSTLAAVILPEFLVTRWWHRLLHNNRALFIKRMLLFESRVVLSSVPYKIRRSNGSR
ncbi:MAG: APC family permease [Actinomycetota bacterium]